MKRMSGEQVFYQVYSQEPGRAEAAMEADVRRTMAMTLYSLSGDPPPEKRWRFMLGKSEEAPTFSMPVALPSWVTEKDVDYFANEFQRTGFRGGLNWYRNIDRNWELTAFLEGAKIHTPALFVAGEADSVIKIYQKAYELLEKNVPRLKRKILIPGIGHWVNQERPAEVNQMILEFLNSL